MNAVLDVGRQPAARPRQRRIDTLHLTLAGLVLLLLWDLAGLDRTAMHLVGTPVGFAWKESFLTQTVLHAGGRLAGWLLLGLLVLNVWRPLWAGPTRADRVRWLAVTLLCVLAVPALKQFSHTSCPWDLAEFGGVARYVGHWQAGSGRRRAGALFPVRACHGGLRVLRRLVRVARPPAPGGAPVAGRRAAGRAGARRRPVPAGRPLPQPHAVDGLAVLGVERRAAGTPAPVASLKRRELGSHGAVFPAVGAAGAA